MAGPELLSSSKNGWEFASMVERLDFAGFRGIWLVGSSLVILQNFT
jgi:hypothetical protein